jgi:hypothetical protein
MCKYLTPILYTRDTKEDQDWPLPWAFHGLAPLYPLAETPQTRYASNLECHMTGCNSN